MGERRISWAPVIAYAATIVRSYTIAVTLRQLFYLLVSRQVLDNTRSHYQTLSHETAKLRRTGDFPRLFDRGRSVLEPYAYDSVLGALQELAETYRLDRTADQDVSIWLGVEKNALSGLLSDWFDDLGIPVLPLGGYSSEDIEQRVSNRVVRDGRPAVLIYAGDFDASGMDIGRNFVAQTSGIWKAAHRIALSEAQAMAYPVNPGKAADTRSEGFIDAYPMIHARHEDEFGWEWVGKGQRRKLKQVPVQVELDAVEPLELRGMYQAVIDDYLDASKFEVRKQLEAEHIERLTEITDAVEAEDNE